MQPATAKGQDADTLRERADHERALLACCCAGEAVTSTVADLILSNPAILAPHRRLIFGVIEAVNLIGDPFRPLAFLSTASLRPEIHAELFAVHDLIDLIGLDKKDRHGPDYWTGRAVYYAELLGSRRVA